MTVSKKKKKKESKKRGRETEKKSFRAKNVAERHAAFLHAFIYLFISMCVRGWHQGIIQTSILLDSCLPPSDASHLRHRHRRPSKPSACLSPLIDLSLDGGVWECFGENMCFDRCFARECVSYKKRAGPYLEDARGAWR